MISREDKDIALRNVLESLHTTDGNKEVDPPAVRLHELRALLWTAGG